MKISIAFILTFCATISFGQDFNDTIAYETGAVRPANILKVTNTTIQYQYKNEFGKIMKTSARIGMLDWYTFDGKRNNLESEFNAQNLGYEDTMYFKSGEVREVRILKETSVSFKYEFVNSEGNISRGVARKGMLNQVIIGNKRSDIAKDFQSKTPTNTGN